MTLKKTLTSLSLGLLLASSVSMASAQEATPGVLGDATAVECVTDVGTAEVPDGATGYTVSSEESKAGFTVAEELNSGATEAVGSTTAVAGTILVDEDGTPLSCSRIDVDLRTLTSDQSRRDGRMLEALDVTNFPLATFIVTDIQGLDGPLEEGTETELTLIGNLTIHGVEKQVSFDAKVTLEDGKITGSATTVVTFDDFDIEKPEVGPVLSIEDDITVTIDIVANAA